MDILILGGGYAGISCATRLAHRARDLDQAIRIRLVNPAPVMVERIRLHQAATGQHLRERHIDTLLQGCGVELVASTVSRIDPGARTVEAGGRTLPWDRLVIAVGSRAVARDAPADALTLEPDRVGELYARVLARAPGDRVDVVGGGLTGIEASAELAEAFPDLAIQLVTRGLVAEGFSAAGRMHVLRTLAAMGVTVRERAEAAGGADLCIWSAGFSLPSLARDAGLQVNASGQVVTDACLRSVSHPDVYAAGDAAAPPIDAPLGCKTAMPMGAQVAENLARELHGEPPAAFDYALMFYCVSLGRRDGLIQWPDASGAPVGRILTGRPAALFKEVICRSTWWALRLEGKGRKGVAWKRTGKILDRVAAA